MSEPCKHEREFAGTQRDTLLSFTAAITEIVKTRAALRVAQAKLAHIQAICTAADTAGQDPTSADIQAALTGEEPL